MEDKKIIEQNKTDFNEEEIEVDEGFESYRKMLARQREMCERLGLKVAYYVPPKKIEDND